MVETLKKILGIALPINFSEKEKEGAIILDVRTKSEFNSGHIKGALNIYLDQLPYQLSKLKDKQKPIK